MQKKHLVFSDQQFSWAVGIEDTFIPQFRSGLRALEEYQLMQHYEQWQEDLRRAASLGVKKIRWGVPWYSVESMPGIYDWSWIDQVLPYMVNTLGLEPIVDLVHYGTPLWMEDSFIDARYVASVSAFQAAFAQRYRDLVKFYTVLNEPTVNAEFSGSNGQWPPYLCGDQGYVQVMLQLARGMQSCMREIAAVDSEAVFVAVEAMHHYRPLCEAGEPFAHRAFLKDVLCFDLVEGRVDEDHAWYDWLLEFGATADEVAELRTSPARFDILGVNFYPWSAFHVNVDADGRERIDPAFADGRMLVDVIRDCHTHARLPIFITETSAGTYQRQSWLRETVEAVSMARNQGLPVIGYTWFPLFSMIEWGYRTSKDDIGNHLLHLGLWDVTLEEGVMVRKETSIASAFRNLVLDTHLSSHNRSFLVKLWTGLCRVTRNVWHRVV